MDATTKSYLEALTKQVKAITQPLVEALRAGSKADPKLASKAQAALDELCSMSLPAANTKGDGWAFRSRQLRPYLAEWSNEPPRQVDYSELSELLKLSETTIRMHISQGLYRGFARHVQGRWVVVVRDPAHVNDVLNERFVMTQHPDDQRKLTKRPAKTAV